MQITWYGTAALKISDGKSDILFDPYIRPNKKLVKIPLETFCGADAVFITHGHFDHILSLPKIIKADNNAKIYCTKTPCDTLKKYKVPADRINVIKPNDKINIGDFKITVYQGRHVDYNFNYIVDVFPKCFIQFPKVFKFEYFNIKMPENEEIVIYEVENKSKRVVIMGSYGSLNNVKYPYNADLFVMPYGGSYKIKEMSESFIKEYKPKSIMIDHFDNSFPPLTIRMDAEGLAEHIKSNNPSTDIIIPTEFKTYDV